MVLNVVKPGIEKECGDGMVTLYLKQSCLHVIIDYIHLAFNLAYEQLPVDDTWVLKHV